MANYRPVSNVTFMSKIIERAVAKQLHHYLAGSILRIFLDSTTLPSRPVHSLTYLSLHSRIHVPAGHRTHCRTRLTRAMVHSATCQINEGVTIRAWYEDGDASNYDVSDGRRHCHVIYAHARAWSITELTVATRWGGSSALARAGAAASDDNEHSCTRRCNSLGALTRQVLRWSGADNAG